MSETHAPHAIFQSKNCLYKYGEQIKGIRIMCGNVPNLYTWSMLYPYNYATNFGGRVQLNVMDTTAYTPSEAFAIRNAFNPFFHLAGLQQNLASASTPDAATATYIQAGAQAGHQAALTSLNKIDFQMTTSDVSGLIQQLDGALTSENLTAEHKNQLRALKRKVEALRDRLNDVAVLQQSGATQEQIKVALSQIKTQYRVLRDEIAAAADSIRAELEAEAAAAAAEAEAAAAAAAAAEEEGAAEGAGAAEGEGAGEEESDEVIPGWSLVESTSFNTDMYAANIDNDAISTITDEIYAKVDGVGSGNVESFIKENIDKDNVVEVVLHWNKHYAEGYAESDSLGFTETIFDEYAWGGKDHVKPIIKAMQSKLAELKDVNKEQYGIAKTQLSIAMAECNAWYCDEDKASTAFNKAHAAMVQLMLIKAQKEKQAA